MEIFGRTEKEERWRGGREVRPFAIRCLTLVVSRHGVKWEKRGG
jgi:hypothetical protein